MKIALAAAVIAAVAGGPAAHASPTGASDVIDAITAAGGTCGALDQHGEQRCTLDGVSFKAVPGEAWTQTAAMRKLACSGGYISADYKALTDDHWMIAADNSSDLASIKSKLDDQGVQSQVVNYCP